MSIAMWLGMGVGAVLLVLLILWLVRPGEELARVAVVPGQPFVLSADPGAHRKFSLWTEVDVRFDKLELRGPIEVSQGREPLRNETFLLSRRGSTLEGDLSRVKRTWISGFSSARGSARVMRFVVPGGSAVTVSGTITAGDNTDVRRLELVLTGG